MIGRIEVDYGEAGIDDILEQLSGAAITGDALWTVSDEGRSLECLVRHGDGFRFHRQIKLDDPIANMLGDGKGERDLEGLAIDGGKLWLANVVDSEGL